MSFQKGILVKDDSFIFSIINFVSKELSNENIIFARSFDSFGNGGKAIKIIKDEK